MSTSYGIGAGVSSSPTASRIMMWGDAGSDTSIPSSPSSTYAVDDDNDIPEALRRTVFHMPSEMSSNSRIHDILLKCREKKLKKLEISNCKIEKIPEVVSTFTWVKKVFITNCPIITLENLPPFSEELTYIGEDSHNISMLDGTILPETLKSISIMRCKNLTITNIKDNVTDLSISQVIKLNIEEKLNDSITVLKLHDCNLEEIPYDKLPSKLKSLYILNNRITSIDILPSSITHLDACNNARLSVINNLPPHLEVLKLYNCRIRAIKCSLPDTINELDLYNNFIESLPNIPRDLETVDLCDNLLCELPDLPKSVKNIDIRRNQRLHLSVLQRQELLMKMNDRTNYKIQMDDDKDDDAELGFAFWERTCSTSDASENPSCPTITSHVETEEEKRLKIEKEEKERIAKELMDRKRAYDVKKSSDIYKVHIHRSFTI